MQKTQKKIKISPTSVLNQTKKVQVDGNSCMACEEIQNGEYKLEYGFKCTFKLQ